MAKVNKDGEAPRNFCQEPSKQYLELLEEAGGDPRVAAGMVALKDKEWSPTVDARDVRREKSFKW